VKIKQPASLKQLQPGKLSHGDLAILVRVKNEVQAIPEFLSRIRCQSGSENAELIFLDSGSTDGTLELICDTNSMVYQIAPEDFAFGSSCNLLMSLCTAPVCVFLSGHVFLQSPEILDTVRNRLFGNGPAAIYLRQVPSTLFGSTAYERGYLAHKFPDGTGAVSLKNPGAFSNAASALTRSAWERAPFPEVAASEDFLWAQQHLALGGRLEYLPQLRVEHSHCESAEEVYRRVKLNVESRKLGFSPARAAKFFIAVFGSALRHGASVSEASLYAASHARAYL
jgi:glycosyltransferase involved in cell wall biosynthesis